MNKKQKQFINTLNKSIEQAKNSRDLLLELFAYGLGKNESNKEYVGELQAFIKAAEKMRTAMTVGFGKPSWMIASEVMAKENGN